MPIRFTITPEDVLRSKLLEPAWYPCKVKDISEELTKKKDSTNVIVELIVKSGPKQKDGSSPVGTPIRKYFNEKAPGMCTRLFRAFGVDFDKVVSEGKSTEVNFDALRDKDVDVYVTNVLGVDGRTMLNNAEDFRPAQVS